MAETTDPITPEDAEPAPDAEFDGGGDTGGFGRSFGLREAIAFSVLSCAAAIAVAWWHL